MGFTSLHGQCFRNNKQQSNVQCYLKKKSLKILDKLEKSSETSFTITGSSSSDTSIDSAFCCTGCSYPAKFTTGNNLYAKFSTDSTLTASESGFQVTILAGKDECKNIDVITKNISKIHNFEEVNALPILCKDYFLYIKAILMK